MYLYDKDNSEVKTWIHTCLTHQLILDENDDDDDDDDDDDGDDK